jgi:hypothetical protein
MVPDLAPYETSTLLDADVDRVLPALTTLDGVRGWWSPIVTGGTGAGATFHVGFEGLDESITVEVARVDRSGVEWLVREHSGAPDWTDSRISFRIAPHGKGSRLELRHEGVRAERVRAGWEHFLESLRGLVEVGEGLPYPWSSEDALPVALRYHAAWTGKKFDEAVALLAVDLETEVPINTYSSRAEWAQALVGFGGIVDRTHMVSALGTATQATLIYDMHTGPYGVLRIAEHFTVDRGTIVRIRHVHDTFPLRASA